VFLKLLLQKHGQVKARLSDKYKYIMVDEYQDTNRLQADIVRMLAGERSNVMVVGDDSQSIYSFRGANFKNIIDFPKVFPGARVIKLEENYRSIQPILNLTNEIINCSKERFEKKLFTRKKGENLPFYVETHDENAQSGYVAEKILELREQGVELGDIAVLFRSGWHSNDLEVELAGRNIPFIKYGGQKFVEAAHIKDIISFLRIVFNMSDAVSWHRVLLLMRGIGSKTAQRLINEVVINKKGLDGDDKLFTSHEDLTALIALLKKVTPANTEPGQLVKIFLEYYHPLLKDKYDDFNKRLNDLDSLERIASRYNSLENFLGDMALEPPERSIVEAGKKDKDDSTLTLSTIHSAKGLEWHTVFLIFAAEGHLPSYLSLEDEEAIEEERRLFYVATTRAKENLFIIKPHIDRSPRSYFSHSNSIFTQPSRFLTEGDILKKYVQAESTSISSVLDGIELEDIL